MSIIIRTQGKVPRFIKILATLIFLISPFTKISAEETLVWQDCVREAKTGQPELISAQEKFNQAKADKAITRSHIFPSLDLSNKYSYNKTKDTAADTKTLSRDYEYYKIAGKQLLFDGFKVSNEIASAIENMRAAEYNYMVVSSNVRLAIRAAFVELLAAQERLGILEDIAKRRRDNLMLVTLNYGAGKEHIGSLLLAQADLEQAKFEIEEAKRNIYASQTRLIKRLGRMKITPVKVQGDFSIAHPERERPNLDSLAESNPFLKEVISKKDAARFGIKSAKADFFPKVYADASRQRDHIGNPRDNTDNWMFGATFSLPVFDGGLRMAEVSKAKALFSQLEADERGGRDNVIVTLDETWKKFQDAIDEVSVRKSYLHAAEERAKITKTQYSLGLISFDNWIIIEEELVRAKKAFLDIQATVLLREAEWIQAKGGTLDYEN